MTAERCRMKYGRYEEIPALWKPFPFAIRPKKKGAKLYYTLGRTRERIAGLVLLGFIALPFLLLSLRVLFAGVAGWAMLVSNVFLFSMAGFTSVWFLWSLHTSRKKSQVCIDLESGQAQVQYQHKEDSGHAQGEICVLASERERVSKKTESKSLFFWFVEKLEGDDVFLVVIRAGHDFEVVGAFKKLESAFEFAQTVHAESGLEIVDEEIPELHKVDGSRSYGTKDSKAMKKRFKSRPF